MAVHTGYGNATLAVLWQGISRCTGLSMGITSFLVALIMIVFVFFYDRKQIHIGTVLFQIFYSGAIGICGHIGFQTTYAVVNFMLMIIGILVLGFGTGLYAVVNMGRGSYEALCFAIAEKHHWQIRYVRAVWDAIFVIIGILLGGKIGLCTIFTILLTGNVIQLTVKLRGKFNEKNESPNPLHFL